MHPYLLSVILGIIEGLTEFLPVSSTAHLRIAEGYLGVDMASGYWKMYSVVIQLGAILSVVAIFWNRLIELLKTYPSGSRGDRNKLTHPISLILLASIVTAIPCLLADEFIGENLERVNVMAIALIVGGIVMWVVDVKLNRSDVRSMEQMSLFDAMSIGAAQILAAMFPGTSRSMVTIAAGQLRGLDRPTALEFSFFLSIPIMFGATALKLAQAIANRPKTAEQLAAYNAPANQWIVLLIGFVVSFIVALLVNRWFLAWVRRRGFAPFAIYRILLGIVLLVWMNRIG